LIYFGAFVIGALCLRLRVFEAKGGGKMLFWIVNSIAWVPVTVYIFFLLYPWFKPGNFIVSEIFHRLVLWFSYQASLVCLMYLVIETFRRYQDKSGRFRSVLNGNSYYVYFIHVIVVGALALIMLKSGIPSLLKYFILTVSTLIVSNLLVYWGRIALHAWRFKRRRWMHYKAACNS